MILLISLCHAHENMHKIWLGWARLQFSAIYNQEQSCEWRQLEPNYSDEYNVANEDDPLCYFTGAGTII